MSEVALSMVKVKLCHVKHAIYYSKVEYSHLWSVNKRSLTISVLTYYMLKYTLKCAQWYHNNHSQECAPAVIKGAHSSRYLNNQLSFQDCRQGSDPCRSDHMLIYLVFYLSIIFSISKTWLIWVFFIVIVSENETMLQLLEYIGCV